MIVCKHCGNELSDTNDFCDKCGKPVEMQAEDNAESAPQIQDKQNKKKSRLPLIIVLSVVGVILCVSILTGVILVSKKALTKPAKVSEETTKTTTVPTATSQPASSETSATEPASEPSSSSVPTIVINKGTAKGVKVEFAANKSFDYDDDEIIYRLPKVVIPGVNTDAVNAKIKEDNPVQCSYPKYDQVYDLCSVSFAYFITDDVVSIRISRYYGFGPKLYRELGHSIYNVSVKTGELMSDAEMLKSCGVTEDYFLQMVRTTYEGIKCDDSFTEFSKKKTLDMVSFENVHPCIGSNGHLCFVGVVWGGDYLGGVEILFDAETHKCIEPYQRAPFEY